MCLQRLAERVLFQDAGIAPAPRSIEFGNNRLAIGQTEGVNTIFVAVQRTDSTIGLPADIVNGIQDLVRVERAEGNGCVVLVYANYSIRSINVAICL